MQSENFDNKIRQAAEQHHPEYDEKAWTKMEKLLDRHLPQKTERRRRFILFLLLFVALGGGAWLLVNRLSHSSPRTLSTESTPTKRETTSSSVSATKGGVSAEKSTNKDNNENNDNKNNKANDDVKETSAVPIITDEKKNIDPAKVAGRKAATHQYNNTLKKVDGNGDRQSAVKAVKNKQTNLVIPNADVTEPEKSKKGNSVINNSTSVAVEPNDRKVNVPGIDKTTIPIIQSAVNDTIGNKMDPSIKQNSPEQPIAVDKGEIAKKNSRLRRNSFFFSVSAGPDVSSVGLNNPGKVRLLAGAGVGYTFRDKITVRTGFYTSRKVYSANRDDYKPVTRPLNYLYIDNIDANCKVFEIPVSISYNFKQSKDHTWFASSGLSSYIMKKENYVYLYKYPNGSTYSYSKTINNEYQHYFSVLTLSAGYERRINKHFSIVAEPYFKLPLGGVGYGKIKLNSTGVLFSVKLSSFQSSSKK